MTGVERERGPAGWLLPIMESAYTRLTPREAHANGPVLEALGPEDEGTFKSSLQPGRGESVLATVPETLWTDRLAEYKRRKLARIRPAPGIEALGPVVEGQKNWAPLGPSVVLNGQAQGFPPVGGRVGGIAVTPDGQRVYAASANGGVFRSDDAGTTWRSLMDAFDTDPTNFASTTLACGAIAIDPRSPDRVFVGTGEGDTFSMFSSRLTNALPAYRGIGPILTQDGGKTWASEPTAAGSTNLAGKAFFALAVDPRQSDNVVGATSEGLYQRVQNGGAFAWVQRRPGVHSSVVVASDQTTTRFFAAEWGKGPLLSTDGQTWTPLQNGFPTANVARISLGVQPNKPNLVYAMVSNTSGGLLGVFRLDDVNGAWTSIAHPPSVLPSDGAQGDYDLALAVDPNDPNLIYLGGSFFVDNNIWPASIWRCSVTSSAQGLSMAATAIGMNAHSDVHVLVHSPGNSDALWVGCDGGIFRNPAPRTNGTFEARNTGMACLCTNFFAQHPTDPKILVCGLQDNGTARSSALPVWTHVNFGDGGYCVINWADPNQVLVFANGTVYRATDGGQDHDSWQATNFPWAMMTEPIVGTPFDPDHPENANLVGLAAGQSVHLSSDFGATWPTEVAVPSTAGVYSMAFASAVQFYVGTTAGEVFRFASDGANWTATRIDNVAAGPLQLNGLIADIGVDWTDASGNSVYIAYGGIGDYRHVWHFDGAQWEARSGPHDGPSNLLDVEHNAITVDPQAPTNVYVGADIGVWHSADGGQNWEPLPNGLPDAPVFDLQVHPTQRLLRASTHGRGLYEYPLDD